MRTFRVIRETVSREEVLVEAANRTEAMAIAQVGDHIHWSKEELISCEISRAYKATPDDTRGRIIHTADGYIEANGKRIKSIN